MMKLAVALAGVLLCSADAFAQSCLHDANESAAQVSRRRNAAVAARVVNTIQASAAGTGHTFLRHSDMTNSAVWQDARAAGSDIVSQLSMAPGEDIVPGWKMTLDLTEHGYWFIIVDATDPCGFAFVSNQTGLVLTAMPLH